MTQTSLTYKKAAALFACAALTTTALATDGKWNADAAGNWSDTSKWTNSQVADGVGAMANISYNITAARTVTLDTPRTVGRIRFEDATTSSHEWTLAGSGANVLTLQVSSGTPIVDAANRTPTINAQVAGTQGLLKIGSGTLCLNNAVNLYTGKTSATNGTLRINTELSLGPVPATYVADQLTLAAGATLMNNNSEPVLAANQGITIGAGGARIQAGWSRPFTINSPIAGAGSLTINNDTTPGVVSLNGQNTYTGPTIVGSSANNWAILLVNGSLAAGSKVGVTINGWLGGTGIINGPVWATNNATVSAGLRFQPGTLTVNNSVSLTNCFLSFDLGNATTEGAGVNDLIQVNGDLALSGTITVDVYPMAGSLAVGTYRLINYTGGLLGAASFVTTASRYTMSVDTNTPGQINLVVTGGAPANLVWQNTTNFVWNVNATTNWLNGTAADVFLQGDNVLFDDTGVYSSLVNMIGSSNSVTALLPASVSVTTSNDVTISSTESTYSGRLAGPMALYKGGSGTLTLNTGNTSMPNYYDGPTVITNGTLKVGYVRALGSINGATYATNGGTLDINAQNIGFEPVVIQGAGMGGRGALVNNAGGQQNALRVLTLAGDATVGGSGRFDVRGSPADTFLNSGGQPFKLTKVGPEQFSVVGATVDPALGDIDILAGTMSYEANTTSYGDPSKTVTVAPEARLLFWATVNPLNKVLVFNGGVGDNVYSGSGSNTIVGPVTVNAPSRWNIGGTSLAVYSGIDGAGGITKVGGSPLYLYGTNTYTGQTAVNTGVLNLGPDASLAKSSQISIAAGATLDASQMASGLALGAGQSLSGSGILQGNVNAAEGSTVVPGSSIGTLAISGQLSLTNAAATFEFGSSGLGQNDLITVGSLVASGVTTIKVVPLAPLDTVNPYSLIQATASLLSPGTETNFTIRSDSRYSFTLLPVDSVSSGYIFLQAQVTGTGSAARISWTGNDPVNPTWWDLKTTTNWLNAGTPDTFYVGDDVVFDDTAAATTVDLVGTLQPALVELKNASKAFTMGGSGSLLTPAVTVDGAGSTTIANSTGNTFLYGVTNNAGTLTFANNGVNNFGSGLTLNGGNLVLANPFNNLANAFVFQQGTLTFDQAFAANSTTVMSGSGQLVKNGDNTLTLSAASPAFSGNIQVNKGTLRVANGSALGDTSGSTTIANGAALDVNGQALGFEPVIVSGAGPDGLGGIVNRSTTANQNAFRSITLAGNTTFGALSNRWDIRSDNTSLPNGSLSTGGNAYNLTKVGTYENWIVSTTVDPALADIDVVQGVFGYENQTTSLGDPARTLTVYTNASLGFYNSVNPLNKRITIQGGGTVFASSGAGNTIIGPVSLPSGFGTLDSRGGVTLTMLNELSGDGGLIKANNSTTAGTVILSATNTFAGNVNHLGGTLAISNSLALGTNKLVAVTYNTGTGTGGNGTRLSLRGGVTTPADVASLFTASTVSGDYRCSITSDSLTNTWSGPIMLNGNNIVGFYASQLSGTTNNQLNIAGPITGTNGFSGTAFFRGAGNFCGEISGQFNAPAGVLGITDNSVWLFDNPTNVWLKTGIYYGRLILGADNAACATASLVLGQPGTSSGTLDLNGFTQTVPSVSTVNGNNHFIGSSSTTSDSLFIYDGGANVSTLDGKIVDSVSGGTRKVAVTVKSGSLTLLGVNVYTGNTIVMGGTLGLGSAASLATPLIDLRAGATLDTSAKTPALALASGQTLKGDGVVNGSLTVGSGATLAPGAAIGALAVTNVLTLQAGGTSVFDLDKSATPSSDLVNAGSVVYGGILNLNNIGPGLAAGDSFKLFNATAYSGSFAEIIPANPGTGLLWDTSKLAIDGTLSVKLSIPTTPTSLAAAVSGNTLTLSWPSDYTGWYLQAQTNTIDVGISTNWTLVTGSTTTNQMSFTIDPSQPTVFYRLGFTPTP